MAFAQKDLVIPIASLNATKWPTAPIIGMVASITPTVVAWEDGTQQTYTASDAQLFSLETAASDTLAKLYSRAKVSSIGAPDPGGRGQGVIVAVTGTKLSDASTGPELATLEYDSGGFITLPIQAFTIVPG